MADEKFIPVPDPLGLAEAAFRKLFPEAKVVPRDVLSLFSEQKSEPTETKPEKFNPELPQPRYLLKQPVGQIRADLLPDDWTVKVVQPTTGYVSPLAEVDFGDKVIRVLSESIARNPVAMNHEISHILIQPHLAADKYKSFNADYMEASGVPISELEAGSLGERMADHLGAYISGKQVSSKLQGFFQKHFPEVAIPKKPDPDVPWESSQKLPSPPTFAPVSQLDTVEYQKKELVKSLTLLEGHLRQGGIIGGKPCDCISKHMIEVEALSDETTGITGERFYQDIASWARQHSFKGLPQAVASGQYKNEYLDMAGQARQFRKQILGTEIPSTQKEAIKAQVREFIRVKEGKP